MENTFNLHPYEQGMLDQILTDLEVKTSEELVVLQAEGDRIIAEAFAQRTPIAILHRRVGNLEKLESFMRHANAIRKIPAVYRSVMQTKIGNDFVGELEVRDIDQDVEDAFCNAISAAAPLFKEVTSTEEEGCPILRATADLFGLVAFTEPIGAHK